MTDPGIVMWRRLGPRLTTSGQPTAAQLGMLRDLGVETIVNLAPHDHPHALPGEAATVARLDMTYVHIPINFAAPTEADFAAFVAAMAAAGETTLHVHCIVNARVSAFVYRWRRDVLGMAEPDACAAMDSVWRPGGVWAGFLGDPAGSAHPHRYRDLDY